MSKFTYNIEKIDEFLEAFVKAEPMPSNIDGKQITPRQWYRKWVKLKSFQAYEKGRKRLAIVEIDEGIIK